MAFHHRRKSTRLGRPATINPAVNNNPLSAYLWHYLEWLRVKGFSQTTLINREGDLSDFVVWCSDRSLHDPKSFTKPMIERYQRHLFYYRKANGDPLAYSSQKKRFSSVKAWFKWLTQENYIPSNPASEVMAVKVPKSLPAKVLSVDEVHHILLSIDVGSVKGLRDRAMLEVLYSCLLYTSPSPRDRG